MVQPSHTYMTTRKTIVLTKQTFVGKVMCLLFNMLSRFVIAFLPRSKRLLISWLKSLSAVILEPKKIKSVTVSPSLCHEVMGPNAMILIFWMLGFKPAFSLSHFLQEALSPLWFVPFGWYHLHIWGYWYFSWQTWFQLVLSSSLAFHMLYSEFKLNKHCDHIQPWCTPFPIWSPSLISCPVLTVASWPAYRFCRRQVRWSVFPSL